MKRISINDIAEYKILPFNIYDENGDIIVTAGDNLTPGKLLQLRYIANLFCDGEEDVTDGTPKPQNANSISENTDTSAEMENDILDNAVNSMSILSDQTQLQLKGTFKKAYIALSTKIDSESIKQIKYTRDKILDNVLPVINKTFKKSQLKMIGNYDRYHGLNVALLTIMLAKKMNFNDAQIADVTLAALLHDIGKSRLPKEFQSSYSASSVTKSNKMYELHSELGYKILKNEMKFPDEIAVVALEHHEKNDGSGYPHGVSSDLIHKYSQMVSICNAYENIISGKTRVLVSTPREAVQKILEMGTNWFTPEILYSFVYMTTYHDDISLDRLGETGNPNWQ